MHCKGCGADNARRVRIVYDLKVGKIEYCNICNGFGGSVGVVDSKGTSIFFNGPGVEENLADSAHPNGYYVKSKRHKQEIMRNLNVVQSG